jgi:transposase-like protein
MCYIDGQKNKYSVLNECNRMLKYNIFMKSVKEVFLKELEWKNEIYPFVGRKIRLAH